MKDATATMRRLLIEWLDHDPDSPTVRADLTERTLTALAIPRDPAIIEAEATYERALAHPRGEGLEAAGARLARLYAEARRSINAPELVA